MICRGLMLVMIAASLSGCIGMGETYARINVRVVDERGAPYRDGACRVELLSSESRQVLDKSTIDSKLPPGFVLGVFMVPSAYRLRIACEESDETFTTEPKQLVGTYPTPVDLGNVRLKRRTK
jgi:hypothetical protein